MTLKESLELNVDFMDLSSGYTYKIQDYNHDKKLGLPLLGIPVVNYYGEIVGYYDPDKIMKSC